MIVGAIAPDAVSAALRETVAPYKRPKLVLVRDELPRNAMGKVEKAVLRSELAGVFA